MAGVHAPAFEAHLPGGDPAYGIQQDAMLGPPNTSDHGIHRVVVVERDGSLGDDWSVVDLAVVDDELDRTAGHFAAVGQRLSLGPRRHRQAAAKRGQE